MTVPPSSTHSLAVGYICWLFGFTGAHRFYFGRPVTGTIWFFTFGLLGIGWIVDLFLMPSLHASAEQTYCEGPYDYTVAWLLLTFLGTFGAHRMYLNRWFTGILWLFTGGLFLLGWLYDLCTLNDQVHRANMAERRWPHPRTHSLHDPDCIQQGLPT